MLRHAVDRLLTKLVSRKLMVWLTATGLMLTETVPLRFRRLGRYFVSIHWNSGFDRYGYTMETR